MRIAFPNIFTSFWFVVMLFSSGMVTYVSFDRNLFFSDLIFIGKFFVGLIILITTGVTIIFAYNFRILFILKNTLYSIKPFTFKLKKIDLKGKLKINWSIWDVTERISCRKIRIIDKRKNKIEFSDFEFENFDAIVNLIDKSENNDEKAKVNLHQAKEDIPQLTFTLFVLALVFAFIVWLNLTHIFHCIHIIFYFLISILSYSAISKRRRCQTIIRSEGVPNK